MDKMERGSVAGLVRDFDTANTSHSKTCINMKAYACDIPSNASGFRVRAAAQYVRAIELAARTATAIGEEEDDDDIYETNREPPTS